MISRQRRIVAAAVRYGGVTVTLPAPARHHHILQAMHRQFGAGITHEFGPKIEDQGFITDDGVYVERDMAAKIALLAGQVEKLNAPPELYSEDLW